MDQTAKNSPILSAIMCDGMGWFTDTDYKRMLLLYDEIYYLLPKTCVNFRGLGGKQDRVYFPPETLKSPSFKAYYFEPDDVHRQLILDAAKQDAENPDFKRFVAAIPYPDRYYTWRITNTDGELGGGSSLELPLEQDTFSHAVLLNKFLWAAEKCDMIPITGKSYIHGLISTKYRASIEVLKQMVPDIPLPLVKVDRLRYNPVVSDIVGSFVPDSELEKRTEDEIIAYKHKHRVLLERFSFAARQMVGQIESLPATPDFDSDLRELYQTQVWYEHQKLKQELAATWSDFFKTMIVATAGGAIYVAVAPYLSLGMISVGALLAIGGTLTPWLLEQIFKRHTQMGEIRKNGLYYLYEFSPKGFSKAR